MEKWRWLAYLDERRIVLNKPLGSWPWKVCPIKFATIARMPCSLLRGDSLLSGQDVLTNPGVWPALKRAIKNREVRIEDPFEQFGLIAPQGMRPESMPIKVKIVIIGDAVLSSLSGVPIKQNIAVTGSVNQKGETQPIGGVNQKIEGFFEVCQAKGLTGDQGVLIPHQNLRNLMLREEVVEAVLNGQFHIYTAKTIDEGIEVVTGVAAGERRKDGTYPEGTINFLVDKQLKEMAERLKGFYAEEKKEVK